MQYFRINRFKTDRPLSPAFEGKFPNKVREEKSINYEYIEQNQDFKMISVRLNREAVIFLFVVK